MILKVEQNMYMDMSKEKTTKVKYKDASDSTSEYVTECMGKKVWTPYYGTSIDNTNTKYSIVPYLTKLLKQV